MTHAPSHWSHALRIAQAAIGLVALFSLGRAHPALAQMKLPITPDGPLAPACLSTVRYFGVGSVTVEYHLVRSGGPYPYHVPRHALPLVVGHRGPLSGDDFIESQGWQKINLLGSGACRFLSYRRPFLRQTITDEHGRRVGLISAKLIATTTGMTP